MTDEERQLTEMLRTLMNGLKLDADGIRPNTLTQAEGRAIIGICGEVKRFTLESNDADMRAWRRAADATMRLVFDEGGPDTLKEWYTARTDLPVMEWPGGSD